MTYFVRTGLALLAVGALTAPASVRAAVTCSSAPAVVVSATGQADVFVIGSDGKAYQRTMAARAEAGAKDAGAGKWVEVGGQCRHGISAIRRLGRIDVFTVAKTGNLVQRTFTTKDGWSKDWADLGPTPGGKCTRSPAAIVGKTGRIDVFVVGNDNKIHQATYAGEGTPWRWSTVGGETKYGPGAANHMGRIELFAIARTGHVAQKTFSKDWTKDFIDRGQPAERVKADSAPAVLVGTTGNFDVFVIGDDKKCYQLSGSGDTSNWANLGGECRYGVGTCSHLKSKTIFTVARSGHLVRRNHDGSAWGKDWSDLGQPAD